MNVKKGKYICMIICSIILLLMSLQYLSSNLSIRIIGDEFGYWSYGAYLSGYDWSEVASYNRYYNWGYGLILYFLFNVSKDMIIVYQSAIILNAFLLIGNFFMSVYFINKIIPEKNEILQIFVAFMITVYPSNLMYVQFTLSETILTFTYWMVVCLSYKIWTRPKSVLLILYCFSIMGCYAIHMRMIGTFFIGAIYLVIVLYKNKMMKKSLWAILFLMILFGVSFIIKNDYQNNFLSSRFLLENVNNNDFSGQLIKIRQLLSFDGIKRLFASCIGKMYYIGTTSILLAWLAIISGVEICLKIIKKRKLQNYEVTNVFLLINIIVMIGISGLNTLYYEDRLDLLLYGRYFEQMLGPLIGIGFAYLLYNNKLKTIFEIIFVYIFVSVFTNYYLPEKGVGTHIFFSTTGIADVFYKVKENNKQLNWLPTETMITCTLFIIVAFLLHNYRNWKVYAVILIISMKWYSVFDYGYQQGCLSWSEQQVQSEIEFAEIVKEKCINNTLYYLEEAEKGDNALSEMYLQFLLADYKFYNLQTKEEMDEILKKGEALLTTVNTKVDKKYQFIAQSKTLALWKKI